MPQVNRMCFRSVMFGAVVLSLIGCQSQPSKPFTRSLTLPNSSDAGGTPDLARVPEWAQGIVWYQVFPERFRNANPRNDPYAWDTAVVPWEHPFRAVSHEEIEMHWNRRIVDPRRFRNDPGHWWGGAGQSVFARRYGGDLQGVVAELDHIAGLGVTGLYLCPVFDARSLHKYDATDHRHVDPTLGHPGDAMTPDRSNEDPADETTWSWEPADRYLIDVLLPEARRRGMRVILDGVWNHVGTDHFAFRDVMANGSSSRYADWFKVEFDEQGRVLRYEAWDRPNGNLPEFRQTPEGNLVPGPKAHVFAVTRRWMDPDGDGDPSDGIDGWRLDVAPEVGRAFWRDWRVFARSINPEALLVGEIWSDAERWFNGVAFDAQMNYPLAYAIADWLSIGKGHTDAEVCCERILDVLNHAPAHDRAQMTLIASHDTERGVSLMQNDRNRSFDNGATDRADGDPYDADGASDDAKRRLMTAYTMLTALPGSPMIYNGDEWALPGADDPDNRRPIHWPGVAPTPDTPDSAFRVGLAELLALRSDDRFGPVLRFGDVECETVEGHDAILIRRTLEDRRVEAIVARNGTASFPALIEGWSEAARVGPFRLLERQIVRE